MAIKAVFGDKNRMIKNITLDSRAIKERGLFVAQKGVLVDGHLFIDNAISEGGSAIVCEQMPKNIKEGITYVVVEDSHSALALLAANFYDNPSSKLTLIGVTGTNGKTTIASLLYQLFKKAGYKVGLLSTVKILVDDTAYKATHTTPNSIVINDYLDKMVTASVTYCFMEVSSHGIHQKRTEGLTFSGGVFTNLSHDHLDYHQTFAAYRDVKKRFFDALPKTAFALVNIDDKNGSFMLQNTQTKQKNVCFKNIS